MSLLLLGAHFFGSLPLRQLTQTLLPRPDAGVDDLEEELAGSRVEYKDRSVDGLRRQVTLERLVAASARGLCVFNRVD